MPNDTRQFYTVWKIKDHLTMPDPEEKKTRYHTYLFVQKEEDLTDNNNDPQHVVGWTHEVTGDISTSTGMVYVHKPVHRSPAYGEAFYAKELLGRVPADEYPENVDGVCQSIKPPWCQKKFNAQTMRYEGVVFEEGEGEVRGGMKWRFYAPGEERKPYFKCTEWVEEKVVPKLVADRIIVD
ncbi:predicted protein [Uncinocarpus reesii 1704]|uniref:Uncharacterized protein n=1 Tax=Uncinocarpus reesii (strain UAMH 1704) TaxID=336963 RepID=C4JEQ2_UNCRE|nr:uncharacterized protein UREG_02212 [Uncinocarpus reesii 1704]EEP77363.1 predicted protein [Uncinocarpus reesii 1704]